MTRPVSPEEQHDWQSGVMPPVRRLPIDLWLAGLIGAVIGAMWMLCMSLLIEGLPNAGKLNGCAELSPQDCIAFAQQEAR